MFDIAIPTFKRNIIATNMRMIINKASKTNFFDYLPLYKILVKVYE